MEIEALDLLPLYSLDWIGLEVLMDWQTEKNYNITDSQYTQHLAIALHDTNNAKKLKISYISKQSQ